MSRIHGFHDPTMEVVEREAAKGYLKLSPVGERAISVDQAGSILTDKGNETTPGARAYWCTGYRANNGFMKDPRTAASVASCLDDEGFINAGPTHQLPALSNVFAGGDICTKARFGGGERMAGLYARSRHSNLREYRAACWHEIDGPLQGAPSVSQKRNGGRNRQRIRVHLAGQDGHALIREVAGDENVLPNRQRRWRRNGYATNRDEAPKLQQKVLRKKSRAQKGITAGTNSGT